MDVLLGKEDWLGWGKQVCCHSTICAGPAHLCHCCTSQLAFRALTTLFSTSFDVSLAFCSVSELTQNPLVTLTRPLLTSSKVLHACDSRKSLCSKLRSRTAYFFSGSNFLKPSRILRTIFLQVVKQVPAMTPDVQYALIKDIRRRMTPQPLKIRADIELKCFQYDGVLHIQDAMRKGEKAGTEDCPVKIKLVAPPLYVLTTQTLDKVRNEMYPVFLENSLQ
jgi:hypothetical protein